MDRFWERFKGKPNTDKILVEKAKYLAPLVVDSAQGTTKACYELLEAVGYKKVDEHQNVVKDLEMTNPELLERYPDYVAAKRKLGIAYKEAMNGTEATPIFLEFVLFTLHIIDRIAFQALTQKERAIFMHSLFVETRESLPVIYESKLRKIDCSELRSLFQEVYTDRQRKYGQYMIWAGEGESPNGTLFWEFGKKITEFLGAGMDASVITGVQQLATIPIKNLAIEKLLGYSAVRCKLQ